MLKSLIYLDENLQSSIALRFADKQAQLLDMTLQVIHVEEPDKKLQAGTGWVRHSWERGLVATGQEEIKRLLKTENIKCRVLTPIVVVGDKQQETLNELRMGMYNMYIEGYLNTSNINDFIRQIHSHLYQEAPCPVLMVKNLTPPDQILFLIGEGTDLERLVAKFSMLYKEVHRPLDITILYYAYKELHQIQFTDKGEAGSYVAEAEELLEKEGWIGLESMVVKGTPEQLAEYVKDYGLIITAFPERRSPKLELLALASNPLLLCK